MELTIRHATTHDIPFMYTISLRSHRASYDGLIPTEFKARFDACYTDTPERKSQYTSLMTKRLKDSNWEFWVALVGKQLAGYTLQERIATHAVLKHGLFVDPEWHGRGIGTALFEASIAATKAGDVIRLSVVADNTRAKHIYSAHGFNVTGLSPKHYFGAPLEVMELQKL